MFEFRLSEFIYHIHNEWSYEIIYVYVHVFTFYVFVNCLFISYCELLDASPLFKSYVWI